MLASVDIFTTSHLWFLHVLFIGFVHSWWSVLVVSYKFPLQTSERSTNVRPPNCSEAPNLNGTATRYSQHDGIALFICFLCEGGSDPLPLHPLTPPPARASQPSRVSSLYISPRPSLLSYRSDNKKKKKKETQQKAPCTLVQTQGERVRFRRSAMWPTTAEVRDPWTPSIRLSAPALASDTHKTPAKEWRHATGKCINVRQTLEPYKIIREALCPTLDMHAAQM